jgi:hypothetical protein
LAGDIAGTADLPTVPGLSSKIDTSQKGAANGVASLDATGKLPSSQLDVTFPVTSVATKTGDVTLTKDDVGLANVDNTSDANKPVSSATQTALDGKANTVHAHVISDVTSLQTSLDAKADAAATTAALAGKAATSHTHAIADVTGLQTAIDGKAAALHTHTASEISDSTAVGRSVLTAADTAAAQSALAIANTVQVVDSFAEVTAPVYGTLYVVRA